MTISFAEDLLGRVANPLANSVDGESIPISVFGVPAFVITKRRFQRLVCDIEKRFELPTSRLLTVDICWIPRVTPSDGVV